jgi:hypothetical protein
MMVTVHNAPAPVSTNEPQAMAAPQPNKRQIRTRQIHAAMY